MINTINGNTFNNPLVNDQSAGVGTLLINGAKPTSKTLYFGSLTRFMGNKAYMKVITPDDTNADYSASLTTIESNLVNLSGIVVSNPANFGFQTSVEDCGNWPFVYSIQLGEEDSFTIPFAKTSALEEDKPIGDVLIFSNENETIAYLHDREVETLETPPAP